MEETVYNDLIKLCDALIDTALYKLMDIDIYNIWKENYDEDIKACVLVQLRAIASIKDRINKLHNSKIILEGLTNETSDSIDKIKDEIEDLQTNKVEYITYDNKVCIDSQAVLDIIDKYRED